MLKNNKKGFTLIEIIVVVVILAVLMAVAVPSLLKYLDTAQEAPALTETHAIVTAAQKRVIEKYSQTKDENISLNATDNKWIEDFVDEGGEIQGSVTVTNKEIARLLYKASNGLYVLYENQEYKIVSGDLVINNVQDYFAYLNRLATENNMSNIPNKNGSTLDQNRTRSLQKEYYEKHGNKYLELSQQEQEMLTSRSYADVDKLSWKPVYDKTGNIVLVADTKSSRGEIYGCWTRSTYLL